METHYTCKHSDIHNFCCGNCAKALLQEHRQRIAKRIEGEKKAQHLDISKGGKDYYGFEEESGFNSGLQAALNIVLEDK